MRDRRGWAGGSRRPRGWSLALLAMAAGRLGLGGVAGRSRSRTSASGSRSGTRSAPGRRSGSSSGAGSTGSTASWRSIAQDEDGTPTTFRQAVQVGPGGDPAGHRLRPARLARRRLRHAPVHRRQDRPAGGRRRGHRQPAELASRPSRSAQDDYQVLALGQPAGVELIPSLPGFNANKTNNAGRGRPGPRGRRWPGSRRSTTSCPAAGTGTTRSTSSCSTPTTRR